MRSILVFAGGCALLCSALLAYYSHSSGVFFDAWASGALLMLGVWLGAVGYSLGEESELERAEAAIYAAIAELETDGPAGHIVDFDDLARRIELAAASDCRGVER
jgi:hypothetical protein